MRKDVSRKSNRNEKQKTHINREKCIRCFCCQEFCPRAAMVAHRPLAAKVLNKLKL